MSHDYQPSWDYPVVELDDLESITDSEKKHVLEIITKAKKDFCPSLGFDDFEVFFVEPMGLSSWQNEESSVAVYCNGTHTRPVIGFDLTHMKEVCEDEQINFLTQVKVSLAHEIGHAYQESLGLDHEHDAGFDEDEAEAFGRKWADWGEIDLALLNPELPKLSKKGLQP